MDAHRLAIRDPPGGGIGGVDEERRPIVQRAQAGEGLNTA